MCCISFISAPSPYLSCNDYYGAVRVRSSMMEKPVMNEIKLQGGTVLEATDDAWLANEIFLRYA